METETHTPRRVKRLPRDTRFDGYRRCSHARVGANDESNVEFLAHLDVRVVRIFSNWRETTPEVAVPAVTDRVAEVLADPLYNLGGGKELVVDYPDLDAEWASQLLAKLQERTGLVCRIAPAPTLE